MCSSTISSLMRSLFIKKSGIWWSLYAACHELSWRGDSKNVAQDGFDPSTLGCRILIWAPHASTAPPSWTWLRGWTLTYSNLAHLVLLRGLDVIRIFPKASAWSSYASSSTYTTLRICVIICWIEKIICMSRSDHHNAKRKKKTWTMLWTNASVAKLSSFVQETNYVTVLIERSA